MAKRWCAGKAMLFKAACELEQLTCIFQVLGTYAPDNWGGVDKLPDFAKIQFGASDGVPLDSLLPAATENALLLLRTCLECVPPRDVQALHESDVV
jgi:hypothetical protein